MAANRLLVSFMNRENASSKAENLANFVPTSIFTSLCIHGLGKILFRTKHYASESYVRVMLRGKSLPVAVRSNGTVRWRWGENDRCTCGERETEQHVLLVCEELESVRRDRAEWWRDMGGG